MPSNLLEKLQQSPQRIMADLQALYQSLVDCGKPEPVPESPKPVLWEGTFRQKLAKYLKGFEVKLVDKAYFKGFALHKMMHADTKTAGQRLDTKRLSAESEFQSVTDLQRFGYGEDPKKQSAEALVLIKIGLVLETIGLDPCFLSNSNSKDPADDKNDRSSKVSSGNNIAVTHEIVLNDPLAAPNVPSPAIISHFMQVINPEDGMIVAYDNLSPIEAYRAEHRDIFTAPDLKFWSDVAFLQWKSRASDNSELKYVLRYNVMNTVTNFVAEAINFANDCKTLPWPGVSYDADSEEGQALLGTPNGSSVAYMLIQHKHQLGHKIVDRITVFDHDDQLMLLFHIVDVRV
jgi:hypothetical protein